MKHSGLSQANTLTATHSHLQAVFNSLDPYVFGIWKRTRAANPHQRRKNSQNRAWLKCYLFNLGLHIKVEKGAVIERNSRHEVKETDSKHNVTGGCTAFWFTRCKK